MKQIFQRMRNTLLNATSVAAIVGSRIYAMRAPQGTEPPYVLLSTEGVSKHPHLRGVASLENARMRLDMFGESFNQLLLLDEAARAALHASTDFSAQYVFGFPIYEDDTRLYHLVADYSVWNDN